MVEETPGGLFDRCPHISNPIYARNGGRDTFFPDDELRKRLQDRVNPVLVYCRLQSVDRMFQGISGAPKLHKTEEHRAKVVASYSDIVADYDRAFESYESILPVIRYDYETDKPRDVLQVLHELEEGN